MAFDFKKEYKEFYMPKNKPEIVNVPKANYVAVRGEGNPNEEGGAYQQAISILYAVAYTLKMSYKTDYKIEGFFEYVVPPLEGFWWQDGVEGVDYANKSAFHWISVIRLPDFVTKKDFEWAVKTATQKKKLDCSSAEYLTIEEGLCVQIMHIGSFDDEPATVALMDAYLEQNGYVNDMNNDRLHHEIYMSDARKVAPEKWKTVIRHPIRKVEYNKCIKESFTVIGKEGSTTDGEDFIQKLWEDANSHFNEVAELAKKDEEGNILGIWGAMSDMSRSFLPWEDGFTKGLYLAGVECVDNAEAPEGWTKWVVPGYEYFYVECEGENTFPQVIKYLEENNIPLVGAVHDFTCPQTGQNYMFFPIGRL